MYKAKRPAAVFFASLLLLLAAACCGCQQRREPAAETPLRAQEQSETAAEGLTVVGFSQVGSESDWRIAHTQSIRSALVPEDGFYLLFEDAQQKQENQIKAVRNFILQDVDYIVLAPIVETGWDAVLQEAKDADIPVILVDRMANVDEDLYTCWLGADFKTEGQNAGQWLESYLEKTGRVDDDIRIVTLQGTLGATAQIGRTEGFADVMRTHRNWTMLEMRDADFTQAKGREVMEDLLKKYDDIDVVVCENDNMAFGAVDAVKAAGKTCGPGGEITIISFDAVHAAFDAMIAGDINVSFECNPLHGPKLADILKKLEAGQTVDRIQYMEEVYFDTDMDLEELQKDRAY